MEPEEISEQQEQMNGKFLELWSLVMRSSNEVLRQAKYFGFLHIESIPDPNIHQVMRTLLVVEDLLGLIISDDSFSAVEYSSQRLLFNAKDQINRLRQVALALKKKDEDEFYKAVAYLEEQAPF